MHMTQQVFANFIGTSPAGLSSIFNERTRPSLATVEAIKNKIPNISLEWLMFGNGKMYKDESDQTASSASNNAEAMLDFNDNTSTPQDIFGGNVRQGAQRPSNNIVKPEVKYVDKPQKHITEIRVFFDDNTYESFVPKK